MGRHLEASSTRFDTKGYFSTLEKKSYKKFDFDQKAITSAEKNSSLTLDHLSRWVGLEAVKERFDSHNIKY